MLRFHSLVWMAALAASLLLAHDSFAQRGGHGGRAGGGAHVSAGRAGGGVHISPGAGAIRSAAPIRSAPSFSIAPRAGANRIAPRPSANMIAPRPSANMIAPRPSVNLGSQRLNSNLNNGRPSAILSNNIPLNRGNLNGSRFDNNRFDNNRFYDDHRHNGFFSSFFFYNPGFFGYWPWNAAYPYYSYYYGGYPYPDYGVAQMPYADYTPAPAFNQPMPLPQAVDTGAQIDVLVPDPDAQVWFDGNPTTAKGMTRYFDSPALQAGGNYTYSVRAAWNQNGQPMSAERSFNVTAGSQVVVDFTQSPPRVIPVR